MAAAVIAGGSSSFSLLWQKRWVIIRHATTSNIDTQNVTMLKYQKEVFFSYDWSNLNIGKKSKK